MIKINRKDVLIHITCLGYLNTHLYLVKLHVGKRWIFLFKITVTGVVNFCLCDLSRMEKIVLSDFFTNIKQYEMFACS